jgi:hypothetical protein
MAGLIHNRLEGLTRGADLLPGLCARVHDAQWLLARQWQFGEFDGADAGSPIKTTVVTRAATLTSWQATGGDRTQYDGSVPLESLLESDGTPLLWRERVAAGLKLARMLRRAGADPAGILSAQPLVVPDPAADPDADPAAHATSAVTPAEVADVGRLAAARVADPDAVAAAFDADLPTLVALAGGDAAHDPLTEWRQWWVSQQPHPSGAWQPDALSYSLSASTSDASVPGYRADRFPGGTLDWHAFDVAGSSVETAEATTSAISTTIPVPATFRGSPVGRYWQLEDASTDFGAIDTYPTELGKLLLAEFTVSFANDWYRVPVRVPYSAAVRVDALVSLDTFGVATLVRPAASVDGPRPWRMFEHAASAESSEDPASSNPATSAADGGWLLIPPVLAGSMDSAVAEEVALVRDPAADLAWGIEHIVTNAVGRPVRRSEDLRIQGREAPPDPRAGLPDTWVWRLATNVPENWIPLLPTRGRSEQDDYELIQGTMLRYTATADGVDAVAILPAGQLLRAGGTLPEREVPREGRTLRRVRRQARWIDGSRVLWWSRSASVGHGEASSGLAYDGLHAPADADLSLGQ